MVAEEVEWDEDQYCRVHRKEKERDENGQWVCDECAAGESQQRRARALLKAPKKQERFPFGDVSQARARQILAQGFYFHPGKKRKKTSITERQRWWLERRAKGLV